MDTLKILGFGVKTPLQMALVGAVFFLGYTSVSWGRACTQYLAKSSEGFSETFLIRQSLEPLNVLSNPLENFILSDHSLDLNFSVRKALPKPSNSPIAEPVITIEMSRATKPPKLRPSDYKIFDLKYVIFDSEYSVMSVSKKYRNVWSTNLGKELLAGKDLLEANPDYRLLLTDAGLSLWTKSELAKWMSDFTVNSLTPTTMNDFIYRTAQDPREGGSVSAAMASRVAKEMDTYRTMEMENKSRGEVAQRDDILSDWQVHLYRSLFRKTLLVQRIAFLKKINKPTELLRMSEHDLDKTLEVLSFFPEFLYQPGLALRTSLEPSQMLPDGRVVFESPQRSLRSFENLDIELRAMRSLDDLKIEELNIAIVITNRNSVEGVSIHEYVKLQNSMRAKWQELASVFKPSHPLSKNDLKFHLEQLEEGQMQLVVTASPLILEQGTAPYLLFGLYNQMY